MATQEKDVQEAIKARIAAVLPTFKALAYQEAVEKNNFRQASKRYGVRVQEANQVSGVTKYVTFELTFELVFTDQYFETNIDDDKKVEATLNLRGNVYAVYQDLVKSKAGLSSQVMNVSNLDLAAPEYITEAKVVVQRANVTVTARLSLV